MGCGAYSQLAIQHQTLTKQLQETRQEKDTIYEDRVALDIEVKQLRSHVSQVISENEALKQKVDKVVSNGRPEIFEASLGEDDVIANWIEMDLRDGDRLLAALTTVHPASEGEINAMLSMSESLRQTESSLQEYCNYFSTRFNLYNQVWAKAVGIQFALDESFKRNKESIAAACQSVESMLGKKSQAMEDLRTEVRNLFSLENADFMDELRRLEAKIAAIKAENFNKRMEEKEAEKQRIIGKYDTEIKNLKAKHATEQTEKSQEMELMRTTMQETIDRNEANYQHSFQVLTDTRNKEKRLIRTSLHARNEGLKDEIRTELTAYQTQLQQVTLQIKQFCDQTTEEKNRIVRNFQQEIKELKEKFAFDIAESKFEATNNFLQLREDCRVEVAKRDKELADFKAFHIGQKAQMRHLTSTWNSLVKSDFVRLASDFQVFEKNLETQVIGKLRSDHETFIQSLRDEFRSTICMLKEDHVQEIKKRDEKEAALIHDYEYQLRDLRNQLEHTVGMMQEDCRVEMAKRDKELADFKALHICQKAQMRHLTSTWNSLIKADFVRMASDFQDFERNLETQVIGRLRSDHETFIQSLRDEFRNTICMLKEDHAEKEAVLVHEYEYRLLDLQYQLQHTVGMMQEDVRFLVQKRDHEYDEGERRQAIELTALVQTYLKGVEDAFDKESKSASETISSLSTYNLDIPVPAVTQAFAPQITVVESESGAKTYIDTLTQLKSVLAESVRNTEEKMQSGQTQVQSLVKNWLDLEKKREHLDAKLHADTEDFIGKIKGLEGKLSSVGESSSQKIEELENSVLQKEAEIKDKENTIEFLNQEVSERFREINDRDASIEDLKGQMSTLEATRSALTSQVEQLNQDIVVKEKALEDAQNSMKSAAGMFKESAKLNSQKRLFTNFKNKLFGLKRAFLIRWRLQVAPAANPEAVVVIPDEDDDDDVDNVDLEDAEEILREEKRLALENNVLMEAFRKAGKPEKPLTVVQVMKFFEEMMDRKYDADLGDIKNQRPLRELPDFMLEHLNRTFGLKKLAIKMLCQIVPTLETMYNEQQPYAMLFCRLIQVYHPDPVPFQLSVFLTKIRVGYTGYTERYQKEKDARDSKRGKKDSGKGKDKGATNQTGGEAYLVDIIAYVYTLFENDRRSGELMLKFLKPEAVEMTDYIMFKLCHKMAKLGLNSEGIFNMLDKDGGGSLGEVEFVRGARRNLELWISPEDISLVFRSITGSSREMTKDAFVNRVNFKAYLENCRSDIYVVSRSTFLTSLIDVYHEKQRRNAAFLKGLLPNRKILSSDDFQAMVGRVDQSIDQEKVAMIYAEALKYTAEPEQGATQNACVRALLRYPVGRLRQSAFGNV